MITDAALAERAEGIGFYSATYRLFKLGGLEPERSEAGERRELGPEPIKFCARQRLPKNAGQTKANAGELGTSLPAASRTTTVSSSVSHTAVTGVSPKRSSTRPRRRTSSCTNRTASPVSPTGT
ncbi:hypothetical protein PA01_15050 [Azoarcus sp. PA01]|nr:hypothetical protein PA01_15050 [Azoarcus sp. PA01]